MQTIITQYPSIFILVVAITNSFSAQFIKFIMYRVANKKWDIGMLFTTGGMPSSHTAAVIGTLIAIALTDGVFSSVFALAFVLTIIVIHDALGIRRHAGKQAQMLNTMVQDFIDLTRFLQKSGLTQEEAYNKKLKEFLGHEPIEVFGGIIWGIIVTGGLYFLFNLG